MPTRSKPPKGGRQKQLSDADFRKLAAFRHALRTFLAFSAAEAEAVGLAPQQHQALLAIRGWSGDRPPTIKDLAAQLLIRHNSAVELVHRLEDGGYLRRNAAAEDHRLIELSLTARGEAALAALSSAHLDELRERAPHLVEILTELTFD